MKKRVVFRKYLIRSIGALCILAAAASLFFPAWIQIDGIRRKDFRNLQESVEQVTAVEESWLLYNLDDLEDDLKDNDLPYKKSGVKSWFKGINSILKDTLDDTLSLKELTVLIWKAPGLLKDTQNLVETDDVLEGAVELAVDQIYTSNYTQSSLRRFQKDVVDALEDATDYFDLARVGCYCAIVISVLLALLVVFAAAGHICNKGRWGKYVLLGIAVIIAVGSFVGLPLLSELLQDLFDGVQYLEDIEFRANIIPVLSVVLLLVPMVLDIVNKKMDKKEQQPNLTQMNVNMFTEESAQN